MKTLNKFADFFYGAITGSALVIINHPGNSELYGYVILISSIILVINRWGNGHNLSN